VPSGDALVRRMAIVANVAMAMFALLVVLAVPQPQAYVVLAAIVGLLAAGLRLEREERHSVRSAARRG
jgi:hypothetical protein